MVIRTKKYKLSNTTYIKVCFKNIIREQWWVGLMVVAIASGTFFIKTPWFIVAALVGFILYLLFWLIQFWGVTQLEQNKLIFEKLSYELTSQQVIIKISPRQGMPIAWEQLKRALKGRDYFVLIVSKAHIIYLPYKIFNSKHEIKFLETVLKRKGLLR